jgi:precorrin-3B methylase
LYRLALSATLDGRRIAVVGFGDLLVGAAAALALVALGSSRRKVAVAIAAGLACGLVSGIAIGRPLPALPFIACGFFVLARQSDSASTTTNPSSH